MTTEIASLPEFTLSLSKGSLAMTGCGYFTTNVIIINNGYTNPPHYFDKLSASITLS